MRIGLPVVLCALISSVGIRAFAQSEPPPDPVKTLVGRLDLEKYKATIKGLTQFGDRRHYQLDVRNRNDALASSVRCAEEGADLLMVKPGLTSIDLIRPIHKRTGRQVGAYQVSGEYAGLALLSEQGLIKFEEALVETWHVFKRAGAQYIITYGARYAKSLGI